MKEKILVVEDDPNIRAILVARLVDIGFAVMVAKDGTEALFDSTARTFFLTQEWTRLQRAHYN